MRLEDDRVSLPPFVRIKQASRLDNFDIAPVAQRALQDVQQCSAGGVGAKPKIAVER